METEGDVGPVNRDEIAWREDFDDHSTYKATGGYDSGTLHVLLGATGRTARRTRGGPASNADYAGYPSTARTP